MNELEIYLKMKAAGTTLRELIHTINNPTSEVAPKVRQLSFQLRKEDDTL